MRGSAIHGYLPARSGLSEKKQTSARTELGLAVDSFTSPIVLRNVPLDELAALEKKVEGVTVTQSGAFSIETGEYTGRSPNDRFWVAREPSYSAIDWNSDSNRSVSPSCFDSILEGCLGFVQKQNHVCIFDGFAGSVFDPIKLRIVAAGPMSPVKLHFATNMFITFEQAGVSDSGLDSFQPDITIVACSDYEVPDWKVQGLNSSACVAFDFERSVGVIAGTKYNGELKKLVFSVANFKLPLAGKLSMHCSATRPVNYESADGQDANVAIYFGLSGTGKTTLGSDPTRAMIGDDEHVWDANGVYNIEGGMLLWVEA